MAIPQPNEFHFDTWTHKGMRYLAVPCDAGVSVVDQYGQNYGAWMDLAKFRKLQTAGDNMATTPVCDRRLYVKLNERY